MSINTSKASNGDHVVHRFDIDLPARIYVNGSQIPPISAEGRLTNLGMNTLQFECEAKAPVPSHGVLSFSIRENDRPIELPVEIISRVNVNQGMKLWRVTPRFMLSLSIREGNKATAERYQKILHCFIYGEVMPQKP